MARHKGYRFRSRGVLKRDRGVRGGPVPENHLREYSPDERAVIAINPAVQRGSPHRRYHGLICKIVERRGRGYTVEVKLGHKTKRISVLPDHLRPYQRV